MSRLDRVIFFSKRDMAGFNMLEKAEKLLDAPRDFSSLDLNTLLEFHHIHQYFENNVYLERWTSAQKAAYQQLVKSALTEIRNFLASIIPGQLLEEVIQLDFNNRENFWGLLQYFELYKKVDSGLFKALLTANPLHIRYVLPLKKLVQHYNIELRDFLLASEESAELLLSHYEEKQSEPSNYIFPKSLTDADKHAIILAYLESPDPNLNYLNLAKNSKHLKLPPKIVLKAKQIADKINDEILSNENSIKISVGASLAMDQLEPVIFQNQDDEIIACYGGAFFDTRESDGKLFSVFSDLFLYTDEEGLIDLVNKEAEMGVMEKIFMKSKNEYRKGVVFARKDMLSFAQLQLFEVYLKRKERTIEDFLQSAITEFFTDQLKGFTFTMPKGSQTPAEKIKLLAPDMEYLLKQYKNYVIDGSIDHELLQIDSSPIYYSEIPSLLNNKYIYSTHESIKTIQYHFFSEDSVLADRRDSDERKPLFQSVRSGSLTLSDFDDYQILALEQAIEAGDLKLNKSGAIEISDPAKVFIAGKLRKNGVISYWHFHPPFRKEIDRLIGEGLLETSNQLFTTDEISYLNYYLNKKEFTNGKDIRNKYLHGTNKRDEKQEILDYLYFLRTFILVLLKLKDDLRTKKIAAK